jgi:creatinine amidohydrolase
MAENIVISEMTWTEVDEAMKDRPVAILPVGATQARGPHLPLSTDVVLAVAMSRRGAAKLKEHGIPALILPPVHFTVAELAAGFAGTVSIPAETVTAMVRDVCVAAAQRFRGVVIANLNLEARHVECLKKAVEEGRKAGATVCYADIAKKRWADTLGETFRDGDHGGAFETSLMMAAAPDQIREKARIGLPPVEGVGAALKKGTKTLVEAGAEDAYSGDPTAASAEDGENVLEALGEILSLSVMEMLGSKA